MPFCAVVTIGPQLLFKLGRAIYSYSFNDVPEARKELMEEISVAREELNKEGADVD